MRSSAVPSSATAIRRIVVTLTAARTLGEVLGVKHSLEHSPREAPWFYGIYTVAPVMQALFVTVGRVARAQCTVMVGGDSADLERARPVGVAVQQPAFLQRPRNALAIGAAGHRRRLVELRHLAEVMAEIARRGQEGRPAIFVAAIAGNARARGEGAVQDAKVIGPEAWACASTAA